MDQVTEEPTKTNTDSPFVDQDATGWRQHSFLLMVGGSIGLAIVLACVAMYLYSSSIASQVDLSLPKYDKDREKVITTIDEASYPSTGTLDKAALDDFASRYDEQVKQVNGSTGFGSDALSDEALGL